MQNTAELEWFEQLWTHENTLETGVVRAIMSVNQTPDQEV